MKAFLYKCPECGTEGTVHTTCGAPKRDSLCQDCCLKMIDKAVDEFLEMAYSIDLPALTVIVREKTGIDYVGPLRMMRLDEEFLRLHLKRRERKGGHVSICVMVSRKDRDEASEEEESGG